MSSSVADAGVWMETQRARALQAVCITFPAGQRDEQPGREGLAHLIEHLFHCRGDEGTSDFFAAMSREGATCNAYTGADYLQFWVTAPVDRLDRWARLVADRLEDPRWSARTVERELRVVGQEVRSKVDQHPHRGFAFHHTRHALFADHGNAHAGFVDNAALRELGHDELLTHFRRFLDPETAVVTTVGPASANQAHDALGTLLRFLRPRGTGATLSSAQGRPHQVRPTTTVTVPRLDGSPVGLALAFPVSQHREEKWAQVLATHQVLAAGLAQMGDRSLIRPASADFALTARVGINTDVNEDRSPSCMTISAITEPDGSVDWLPDAVSDALAEPRLADTGLWSAAKAYVTTGVAKKVDLSLARARVAAWLQMFERTDIDGYFDAIRQVDAKALGDAIAGLRAHGGAVIRL